MLIEKEYRVKVNSRTIKYYENLGYEIPKCIGKNGNLIYAIGEYFLVDIKDIKKQSNIDVDIICDYCGKPYSMHLDNRYKYYNNGIIQKDACEECCSLKTKESNLLTYEVDNPMKVDEIKNRLYKTNINKYGCKLPLQNEEIKEKVKNTILQKYGQDNLMKISEVKEKVKNTNLEKYGFENPSSNQNIQNKIKITNLERYGFESATKSKKVKDKIKQTNLQRYGKEYIFQVDEFRKKANETLYKNGTAPCSKQQEYIHNTIGGEVNYPIDRCLLDIAFPEEKIYIEYDGGGHDLSVKLGTISEKEFQTKEIKRYYFLKSKGWKLIKIISENDYVLKEEDLIKLINDEKRKIIKENLNHITIIFNKEHFNNLIKI